MHRRVVVVVGQGTKYLVPVGSWLGDVADQDPFGAQRQLDIAFDSAVLQQNLRNSDALGVSDLDYLSLHNYIVITELTDVNLFSQFHSYKASVSLEL